MHGVWCSMCAQHELQPVLRTEIHPAPLVNLDTAADEVVINDNDNDNEITSVPVSWLIRPLIPTQAQQFLGHLYQLAKPLL